MSSYQPKDEDGQRKKKEPFKGNMKNPENIRLEMDVPNWKLIKDKAIGDCCLVDFGKRIMKYDPDLYWPRYAGTKKDPILYIYAIRKEEL